MEQKVTLQDIATQLNISRTTVHRALHGKEGVSVCLRQKITDCARQMGYTANYAASSLKRKTVCLVAVLPNKEGVGQLYHKYFWDAIEEFLPEANSLNADISCYGFREEGDEQLAILQSLFEREQPIDGLITMVAKTNDAMRNAIERFSYAGIPVVLLDNDLPGTNRLCCVAPHDELLGRLGAEILTALAQKPGKILIAGGSLENTSHRYNLIGFSEFIADVDERYVPIVLREYGSFDALYQKARHLLTTEEDIVGFYSVTARDTIPLCQAVSASSLAGKIKGVGSDLYPESARLLQENVLQALIYKNAFDKGLLGMRILFDYVVKNIIPPQTQVTVPISVVMKNNLPFFKNYI